jgi:hypothetical protein
MDMRSPDVPSLLRRRWFFGALLGSVLSLAGAARAEDLAQPPAEPTLAVGAKVRLRAPATGKVQGIVIEMEEAFLHVRTDDGPVKVPRDAIARIEVGAGRRRRTLKGMVIGAAMGGTSGGLGACCQPGGSPSGSDVAAAIGAGLATGATIGAAVGYFIKSEGWTSLPVDRVRVGIAPSGKGGVALSLALRF